MGINAMLNVVQATGREYPPLSAEDRERGFELADYFDGLVEVESDDN